MKPKNWDKLDNDARREYALMLANSMRGHLVVGQALAKAVDVMRREERPEHSNIQDMEAIGMLFEPWFTLYASNRFTAISEDAEG